MNPELNGRRAALVIAHPGHELRVFHWMQIAHPVVFILTDGSGRTGKSRLNSTTGILDALGSPKGSLYGRLSDREVYTRILKQDFHHFVTLTWELAEEFMAHQVDYVVGDAAEGYNPTHDLCRWIIQGALQLSELRQGTVIQNFEILLGGRFVSNAGVPPEGSIRFSLEDRLLDQKLKAVRSYPELAMEVDEILENEGLDAIRQECLWPVTDSWSQDEFAEPPYYERYGERQVAAGHYHTVLRYREHMHPLKIALRNACNPV